MASAQLPTQKQNLDSCDRKFEKICCETFPKKHLLLNFCQFICNILSMIAQENIFSFKLGPDVMEFKFSVSFSISKGSLALKIHV